MDVDHFNRLGCEAFIDGNLRAALDNFSSCIELEDKVASYYLRRSKCNQLLGKLEDALTDSMKATKLDKASHAAVFQKGVVAFELEEFETAKAAFTICASLVLPDEMKRSCATWLRKCAVELKEDIKSTVPPATVATPAVVPTHVVSASSVRMEHFQSASFVTISFLGARGVPKSAVDVEFTEATLSVTIKLSADSSYTVDMELFDRIVPAESSWEVTPSKVEIKMRKSSSVHWPALEGTASASPPLVVAPSAPIAVPEKLPSAYSSGKNWSSVEKDLAEELEKEGEDATEKLFKQIYKDADENTRRAMNKSFQTSGGTVLSTNWKEVAEKDYEKDRVAPSGYKWEKVDI